MEEDVFIIKHATKLLLCLYLNDETRWTAFLNIPIYVNGYCLLSRNVNLKSREEIPRMIYRFCVINTEPMIDGNTDQQLHAQEFFIRILISFCPN